MAQETFSAGTGSEGKGTICRRGKCVDSVAKNTGCNHLNADDAQRDFIAKEFCAQYLHAGVCHNIYLIDRLDLRAVV